MIETKVSEMLEAKAANFRLPRSTPERVLRRARARRARNVGTFALVAVALSAAGAVALRTTPGQSAFAAFTLVDQQRAPGENHAPVSGHHPVGAPLTHAQLEQHVSCMRAHGVNVPDPQATAEGWTIPVESPPFRSEKAFRQALFVNCRLENVTENLVLGGRSQAYIDRLMACTRARGFTLPPPPKDPSGKFQFDLNKATPAWGSEAWYRVVFVTCAGPLPSP